MRIGGGIETDVFEMTDLDSIYSCIRSRAVTDLFASHQGFHDTVCEVDDEMCFSRPKRPSV